MKYYIQVEQENETVEYEFGVDCLYIKCAVCGCKCHPVELLRGEPHNEWEKMYYSCCGNCLEAYEAGTRKRNQEAFITGESAQYPLNEF